MRNHKALLVICISLICIVPLSYALSSSVGTRQNIAPPPGTISQSLRLVSTERVEDRVKIALKNVSNRAITGYQLSVNGGRVQVELLDADESDQQALAPGEIQEDWYKLRSASTGIEVIVLAVVFDGGKSEGNERFIKEIRDVRAGKRMQLARILPLLKKAEAAEGKDTASALEDLEAQIVAITDVQDANLSGNVELGLQNGKEFVLHKIRTLKQTNHTRGLPQWPIVIGGIRERTEKRLAKLADQ